LPRDSQNQDGPSAEMLAEKGVWEKKSMGLTSPPPIIDIAGGEGRTFFIHFLSNGQPFSHGTFSRVLDGNEMKGIWKK